jgi:hypothetical protein
VHWRVRFLSLAMGRISLASSQGLPGWARPGRYITPCLRCHLSPGCRVLGSEVAVGRVLAPPLWCLRAWSGTPGPGGMSLGKITFSAVDDVDVDLRVRGLWVPS